MEVNTIKPGSWVALKSDPGTYLRVKTIFLADPPKEQFEGKLEYKVTFFGMDDDYSESKNSIVGIFITKKILRNLLGFTYSKGLYRNGPLIIQWYEAAPTDMALSIKDSKGDDYKIPYMVTRKIQCIHELQMLNLIMTGDELIAKEKKVKEKKEESKPNPQLEMLSESDPEPEPEIEQELEPKIEPKIELKIELKIESEPKKEVDYGFFKLTKI